MPTRRDVLQTAALAAVAHRVGAQEGPAKVTNPLPRWRGFNLLHFFQSLDSGERSSGQVREDDLRWIRDWGFNFVRLPMDYWLWVEGDWRQTKKMRPENVGRLSEAGLARVDQTVERCRAYGLHLNLNFHRAPGYCINERDSGREPYSLWRSPAAEDAFVHHWEVFAKRYREVPPAALSYNLVNEAPSPRDNYMTREDYRRVMTRATEAIRAIDPQRLILIDGYGAGSKIVDEMIPAKVAQSVHAYWPSRISHYRAGWVDRESKMVEPTWPLRKPDGSVECDRSLLEQHFAPWAGLIQQGIGVHCGECGAFNKTPYRVFWQWFETVLDILTGHGIGYSLWEFRGSFGLLDSGRQDIAYVDWQGHKLDQELLTLLQRH
ncbi:MAG: cellulase family glycosylhydrolase [Fimbriimonadaceae bacterium]|nr:cellulase family glycosylhydrolase [Fimbriimonadaceae bacterium]